MSKNHGSGKHQDAHDSSSNDDDDGDEENDVDDAHSDEIEPQAGPSSFNCSYCPSRYQNESELRQHENLVHPHRNTNNRCPHCSFTTPDYYGECLVIITYFIILSWINLELIDHVRAAHPRILNEERSQRLEGKTKKRGRTYRLTTGRPEKSFCKRRCTSNYFDIVLLDDNNQPADRPARIPALCVGESLDSFRDAVIRPHVRRYFNQFGSLRFNIRLRVVMERAFRYSSDDEQVKFFNSHSLPLNSMSDFTRVYNDHCQKIHHEFRTMLVNGSGWTLKNITGIYCNIMAYRPFRGGFNQDSGAGPSRPIHLQVPAQIRNSGCVVNLSSSDNDCFKYAVLCAAFYNEMKEKNLRPGNISSYNSYLNKLNFDGIEFPVKLSNEKAFQLFEANNTDFSLNIMTLKTDELHSTPGRRTRTRTSKNDKKKHVRKVFNIHTWRTSPFIRDRFPLYLLLLYNPRTTLAHFTTVTKLDVLLQHARPTTSYHKSIVCFECKSTFTGINRQRNYNIHFNYCTKKIYTRNLVRTSVYKNLKTIEDTRNKSVCLNCHTCYTGGSKQLREEYLKNHLKNCLAHPPAVVKIPSNPIITFDKHRKQRQKPFRIYSDTESVLAGRRVKSEIDKIIKEYKSNLDNKTEDDADEEDLRLDIFYSDDEDEEEEEDSTVRDYNIEIDETEMASADPPEQNHTLHNHEISGFSFNVVSHYPCLQRHFKQPITYSGVDAGKLFRDKIIIYNLSPRFQTI